MLSCERRVPGTCCVGHLCGASCQCPDCRQAIVVPASPSPEVTPGDIEEEARNCVDSVPAGKGAVARICRRPAAAHAKNVSIRKVSCVRRGDGTGAYILLEGHHLVACSSKKSEHYHDIMKQMHDEVLAGAISTKTEAKARLEQLVAEF